MISKSWGTLLYPDKYCIYDELCLFWDVSSYLLRNILNEILTAINPSWSFRKLEYELR